MKTLAAEMVTSVRAQIVNRVGVYCRQKIDAATRVVEEQSQAESDALRKEVKGIRNALSERFVGDTLVKACT